MKKGVILPIVAAPGGLHTVLYSPFSFCEVWALIPGFRYQNTDFYHPICQEFLLFVIVLCSSAGALTMNYLDSIAYSEAASEWALFSSTHHRLNNLNIPTQAGGILRQLVVAWQKNLYSHLLSTHGAQRRDVRSHMLPDTTKHPGELEEGGKIKLQPKGKRTSPHQTSNEVLWQCSVGVWGVYGWDQWMYICVCVCLCGGRGGCLCVLRACSVLYLFHRSSRSRKDLKLIHPHPVSPHHLTQSPSCSHVHSQITLKGDSNDSWKNYKECEDKGERLGACCVVCSLANIYSVLQHKGVPKILGG